MADVEKEWLILLTTTGSFGTLAFSDHIGMRGLGILLTAGMILTVICTLVVLPALLELRRPKGQGRGQGQGTLPAQAWPEGPGGLP